jgi:hypothetical protein
MGNRNCDKRSQQQTSLPIPSNFPSTAARLQTIIQPMSQSIDANLPKVLSVLDRLTEEELVQLNHVVIERLRLIQQIRSHGQMMNFRLGQRVQFNNASGQMLRGVITRYNRKSVTVIADDGIQWRIAPGLLQPA